MPKQLNRLSLREQARQAIRTSVITGELDEGKLYSVGDLAADLGVSATPIREALGDLEQHGLVRIVRNRGFMVVPVTTRDLDEIFEVRLLLEVPAVERLAGLLGEEDRQACRSLVVRGLQCAADSDIPGFLGADREFHLRLLAAHGNGRLVEVVDRLRDQARLYGLPQLAATGRLIDAAEEHKDILDALEAGDASRVRATLTHHLEHTRGLWAGSAEDGAA
jgi:DNA-binding GntR family transcriptional regulator